MPSHPLSYNVHTPQQSQKGKKWVQKVVKGKPKTRLVGSIIATYILVAGIIGFAMFSGFQDQSEASTQSAYVSASLRLIDEEEYKVGSKVVTSLTIQNTSITDPINNLNIEMNSTQNSVSWESAVLSSRTTQTRELKPVGKTFTIPLLAAGERVEYTVTGTLLESEFDFLTLVGQLTFKNREGPQDASTNRVFTKLQDVGSQGRLLALETKKDSYKKEDKIEFKLSYQSLIQEEDLLAPQVKGKIYLTQKETKNVVASLDCQLGNQTECQTAVEKLEPGNYTALFIDDQEQVFSQISQFEVTGQAGAFTPSNLAILEMPFNSQSINGIVPVMAKKVIGLNDKPGGEQCTFEILQEDKVLNKAQATVQADRTCWTTLDSSQFSEGGGEYIIRLAGSSKSAKVYFSQKSSNLIPLQNLTPVMKVGNSVQVSATDIPDLEVRGEVELTEEEDEEENTEETEEILNLLEEGKATLGIWHPRSGSYKEITNFGGVPIEVIDGQLNVNIPGEEFSQGGFYSIYFELEDGRHTEFLGLSFDDEVVAFSQSGVLVNDLDNLRVGRDVTFELRGVTDRSGNPISQAECAVNLYQATSGPVPATEKGEIKDGTCKVTVPKDKVTRSGPVLVTFTGDNIANRINQSRQLYFAPASPENYGFLGLEYEPAKANYANNFLIGPVTDAYGNTTNAFDHKIRVFDVTPQPQELPEEAEAGEDEAGEPTANETEAPTEPMLLAEYPVNVEEGFAKVTAPSSLFSAGRLKIVLFDAQGKVLKEKEIEVQPEPEKLILPNFPDELNSDDRVQFGLTGLNPEAVNECKLLYFKSQEDFGENKVKINAETGSCEFDWNLNQFRDNPSALIQLQAGGYVYTHIVRHHSGQPSSLFINAPQLRINERDEVEVELLTSPITDINGRPVDSGVLRWEYNGKTEEIRFSGGFGRLHLTADKINNQDLRSVLDQKYLELSLDARASVMSVNKTRSLSIYLGTKALANTRENFAVQAATTRLRSDQKEIFQFQTQACSASILSDQSSQKNVLTHWQGGTCYVQVNGDLGDHRLLFEENGFTLGTFDYTVNQERAEIVWCDQAPCEIQVITQNRGGIEAIIYDEDKQYKFESESIENIITLEQNGLNPLKEYLVEIRFQEANGELVSVYKTIAGEKLQGSQKNQED